MYTEESRTFYDEDLYAPIVATVVGQVSEAGLARRYREGFVHHYHSFDSDEAPKAVLQILARYATTGNILPQFYALSGRETPLQMTAGDVLRLSIPLNSISPFPMKKDYEKGSDYSRARSVIEQTLSIRNIHLGLRESNASEGEEARIRSLAQKLTPCQLGVSASPELATITLGELVTKAKGVITAFRTTSGAVTASTAVIAINSLAQLQYEAAISVTVSGVAVAIVFRFGDFVDRLFTLTEREMETSSGSRK